MVDSSKEVIMDWSKEKLKKHMEAEVTKLFTGILDYAEVAVDSKERWKVLRARILKLSNDAIRDIKQEIDNKYSVNFLLSEESIVIRQK